MPASNHHEWAVVRVATVQKKKGEMGRLLFASVTELPQGRPVPASMSGADCFKFSGSEERLFFRRTLLSREDAIEWYRSLDEGEMPTPRPTRPEDRDKLDGLPIRVQKLEDAQPWPNLGLPMTEGSYLGRGKGEIDPAPFIGSVPGRVHRRFGERIGLDAFLRDAGAQAFLSRRIHVNLFDYQEYLGSVVYVVPDPVVRQIDNFMVEAKDGRGERIIYRIVPRPGQSLEGLRLTAFDKEARLLTGFNAYEVPADGILDVDKGTCMGEYGFVLTHDQHGILAYQPSVSFLRQISLGIRVNSGNQRKIRVPLGDSPNAPSMEYPAAAASDLTSRTIGRTNPNPGADQRVATEARKRERLADALNQGQRWFPEGSRHEAALFVQELLRVARSSVMIADPYLGPLQLGQFLYALHGRELSLTLLTTKLAFNPKHQETKLGLLEKFKRNLDDLEERQSLAPIVALISPSSLHDRFLIVDGDAWFLGNSLNSLGEKASMIVKLPNPGEVIERLRALASTASSLDAYINKLANARTGEAEE